jgi:cation diffusion facilitator CzcD-associated flavoprotein CzcO
VIGAGLSGINAGILFPAKVPGIDLTIFEKNADVGGTWFENIYPGVRCDIPSNVYQSTFSPKANWTEEYAQGAEILDYWKGVAKKYNVYQYLRLQQKIISAVWNEKDAKWTLSVEKLENGERYEEDFNIIITAIGRFNAWKLPDYPGIKDFEGHLRHSSNWDPDFDPKGRFYQRFGALFKGSESNKALRDEFIKLMAERLKKKPELLAQFIPDFSPNCRRLTPGPGYLEALTEDNVSFIQTPISHFTASSVVTTDGFSHPVDAVICSTGANIDMLPPFPITANGKTLQDAWTPDPITYLGVGTPGFPNLLFIQGPNGTGAAGTVPNQVETQVTHLARLLRKVSSQEIKTFEPSKKATEDSLEYSDKFFEGTVWTEECSSWANGGRPGGRIHGHWPGSASHLSFVRKDPRWEDWVWGYGGKKNRFSWLGNVGSSLLLLVF